MFVEEEVELVKSQIGRHAKEAASVLSQDEKKGQR